MSESETQRVVVAVADLERVVRAMVRDEVRAVIDARAGAADVNLISLRQWARRNGVSYSYARQRVAAGDLEVVRFGRAVRVAPDAKVPTRQKPATSAAAERALAAAIGGAP